MPSVYDGIATVLLASFPSSVSIASSTNASPISVTTSAPHGVETGDTVVIHNHLVNTNANGAWQAIKTSATSMLLVGSTGNGVGGATGLARSAAFGISYQIPSGTDAPTAASVDVGLEALGDRTAALVYMLQYAQQVHGGGKVQFDADATLELKSGAVLQADAGSELLGNLAVGDGTIGNEGAITVSNHSGIIVQSGGDVALNAGSTAELNGAASVGSTGIVDVLGSGIVAFESTALLHMKGGANATYESGAQEEFKAGATLKLDVSSTLDCNGNASFSAQADLSGAAIQVSGGTTATGTWTDSRYTTRDHATVYDTDNGYVGERARLDLTDATVTIDPWKYEVLFLTSPLSVDRAVTLNDPPNNERIRLHIEVGEGQLNGHHLSIKDSGGTPIIVFDGSVLGSVHFGWAALRYGSGGNWLIMHAGRIDLSGSPPTI